MQKIKNIYKLFFSVFIIISTLIGCGGGGVSGGDSSSGSDSTTPDPYTVSVQENQTSAVTASVSHTNVLTYSLALGVTDNDDFNINSSTGVVTFKGFPDYETKKQYKVTVNATDGIAFNSNIVYTINITDVNDPNTFNAAENQTSAITATVSHTNVLTYSLAAGITDNDDFNIDASTAVVTFKVAPDFETKTQYKITVNSTDGSSFNTDIVYTINITDVDDTAPIFTGSFTSNVAENQTSAFTATVSDSNTITYSLGAGITDNDDFNINSSTGVLTFKVAPDFEAVPTKTSYSITVTATDSLSNVSTQVYTLGITNVDDDVPVFTGSFSTTVAENQTSAITANATDLNTITYSLDTGVTDNDDFNINSSAGVLTFKVAPDYETKTSYSITVRATDSLSFTSTQVYTVNISDVDENAPVFNAPYVISGDENQTSVSSISVTDANTITYSLASGVNENDSFSINSSTGAITFNTAPNYEAVPAKTSYSITVRATDSLSNTSSQVYTVNVNDVDENPPSFTAPFTASAAENQKTAFTASATDASTITYTLDSAVTDNDTFSINSSSGAVTFKLYPDFEATPSKTSFSITVRATDTQSNTSTQVYTLSLTDVNENLTFNALPYKFIISQTTGRFWLDRNIGATQVCTASGDTACYGNLYQFGRLRDGHELITVSPPHSSIVNTKVTNIVNAGTSNFIYGTSPVDWISDQTNIDDGTLRKISWSQTNGDDTSNKLVCPSGYRIPTNSELKAETVNNGVTNSASAFSNFLKLPVSGYRNGTDGTKGDVGIKGYLWSSDVSGGVGKAIDYDSSSINEISPGFANAYPIRCIKDISTNISTSIDAGVDQTVYQGDSVTLTATAGFASYEWKEGGVGTTSLGSAQSLVKSDFTAGTHYLTVIGTDSNGKESIDTVTVTVKSTSIIHNGTRYNIIKSPITSKYWLDRNIGASQECVSSSDGSCYGGYFQWGRLEDGHEINTDITKTMTQVSTLNPGNDNYIIGSDDWTSFDSADPTISNGRIERWAKTDGTSICPVGFRVPIEAELVAETIVDSIQDTDTNSDGNIEIKEISTAFQSFLKIPAAGFKNTSSPSVRNGGTTVFLWTNTHKTASAEARYLDVRTGADSARIAELTRGFAGSVRCIED